MRQSAAKYEANDLRVRTSDGKVENFMPRVSGKAFRCQCGANVFHKPDMRRPEIYECNGCGVWYEGE